MPAALRVGVLGLAAAAAILVASCTDLGGLSGAGGVDAAAEDAPGSEGGSSGDGGGAGDGASAPFCQSQQGKELCVDFDDGTLGALTGQQLGDGSINVIDRALVVSVPGGTGKLTGLGKGFPLSNVERVVCELDFERVTAPPSSADQFQILAVAIVAPGYGGVVASLVEGADAGWLGSEAYSADGGGPRTTASTPRVSKPGARSRLRFDLSLVDRRLQVSRDGVSLGVMTVPTPPPSSVQNVIVTLGLGPIGQTTAAWTVAFDNITCDL